MKASMYRPPKQSGRGQAFDAIFVLVLIYAVLLLPILLGLTAGKTETKLPEDLSWEALGQNPQMVAQWEKLGVSMEAAAEQITARYDYSINPIALIITAAVIIGYFFFVLKMSDKEYRDVIHEKFDLQE